MVIIPKKENLSFLRYNKISRHLLNIKIFLFIKYKNYIHLLNLLISSNMIKQFYDFTNVYIKFESYYKVYSIINIFLNV